VGGGLVMASLPLSRKIGGMQIAIFHSELNNSGMASRTRFLPTLDLHLFLSSLSFLRQLFCLNLIGYFNRQFLIRRSNDTKSSNEYSGKIDTSRSVFLPSYHP
jgi:hypothetical protein